MSKQEKKLGRQEWKSAKHHTRGAVRFELRAIANTRDIDRATDTDIVMMSAKSRR